MTFPRDKMLAIGALVRAMYEGRGIRYLAGLWGDSVRAGLMWKRQDPGSKLLQPLRTQNGCQVPSWTWASQMSAVSFDVPVVLVFEPPQFDAQEHRRVGIARLDFDWPPGFDSLICFGSILGQWAVIDIKIV